MSEHFNGLTPAQAEALALLSEECNEVGQIIGKILRHGLHSCHPDNPGVTNATMLEKEIADVHAAIDILIRDGLVIAPSIDRFYCLKVEAFRQHPERLHHVEPL